MSSAATKPNSEFERRVTEALDAYECELQTLIDLKERWPRLSIIEFTKKYGLSRTVLYDEYPHLRDKVKFLFQEMTRKHEGSVKAGKRKSITALEAEILRIKRSAEQRVSVASSILFVEQDKRCGPAMRDHTRHMLDIQDRDEVIADLRLQVRNQAKQIGVLMTEVDRLARQLASSKSSDLATEYSKN